jgi:integrase
MDIAPLYSGSASGIMNTGSALAAILSPVVFGAVIDRTHNWNLPFPFPLGDTACFPRKIRLNAITLYYGLFRPIFREMASLWKNPKSKYFIGCFTAADGRQLKRSTRETDRRKAQIIVQAWEQAESLGSTGVLTSQEQLRLVLEQTLFRLTGKKPETITATVWLSRWLEAERGSLAQASFQKYKGAIGAFLRFLDTRAHVALEAVTTDDFLRFRDHLLAEGRTPRTVNHTIRKILTRPFQAAVNQGYLSRNPVAAVRHLRDVTIQKGTFTPEQIRALLAAASPEWKGFVLAGYYTGARLTDLSRLTWANIDLAERAITFRQKKTDQGLKVPIHPELEDYLLSVRSADDEKTPLFPSLYGWPDQRLSWAFRQLLATARIDAGIARTKTGAAGRNVSRLSFHSLRHSFTSALANAGVPAELRQKLTGHADAKSHAIYTHHELETIREALEKLGRLPKEGVGQ